MGGQNAGALPPESADTRKTATWVWSKADTEHRRHVAATQPTLAPIHAFLLLDTISVTQELTAGGIDRDQAEVIANAMRRRPGACVAVDRRRAVRGAAGRNAGLSAQQRIEQQAAQSETLRQRVEQLCRHVTGLDADYRTLATTLR